MALNIEALRTGEGMDMGRDSLKDQIPLYPQTAQLQRHFYFNTPE